MKISKIFSWKGVSNNNALPLFLIFFLSLFLRLFVLDKIHTVNNDALLYLSYSCHIDLSNLKLLPLTGIYPIFIYITNLLTPGDNLLLSARLLNIVAGSLLPVISYFILRNFINSTNSLFVSIILAIHPFLVEHSVDIIKDPLAWLFFSISFFLFLKKKSVFLVFSILFLILASLFRVEILFLCIPMSLTLIVIDRDFRKTLIFCFPILFICLIWLIYSKNMFFIDEIRTRETIFYNFLNLKNYLNNLSSSTSSTFSSSTQYSSYYYNNYLSELRDVVFFLPFLVLLKKIFDALYLPVFVLYLYGFFCIKKINNYWVVLIPYIFFSCVIYFWCLNTWTISERHIWPLIIISLPILAIGFKQIAEKIIFLKKEYRATALLLSICILLLPISIKERRTDNIFFRNLGEEIRRVTGNNETIWIEGSSPLITLYANESVNTYPRSPKDANVRYIIKDHISYDDNVIMNRTHNNKIIYLIKPI
jgi:hypothetical protein